MIQMCKTQLCLLHLVALSTSETTPEINFRLRSILRKGQNWQNISKGNFFTWHEWFKKTKQKPITLDISWGCDRCGSANRYPQMWTSWWKDKVLFHRFLITYCKEVMRKPHSVNKNWMKDSRNVDMII